MRIQKGSPLTLTILLLSGIVFTDTVLAFRLYLGPGGGAITIDDQQYVPLQPYEQIPTETGGAYVHWDKPHITYWVHHERPKDTSSTGYDDVTTQELAAIKGAFKSWGKVDGIGSNTLSLFTFSDGGTTTQKNNIDGSQNVIYWSEDNDFFGEPESSCFGGVFAVTLITFKDLDSGRIADVDIALNGTLNTQPINVRDFEMMKTPLNSRTVINLTQTTSRSGLQPCLEASKKRQKSEKNRVSITPSWQIETALWLTPSSPRDRR